MMRRTLLGAALALFAGAALAGAPAFAPAPLPRPLPTPPTGPELVAAAEITGDVAYLVIDLDTGETLEALNADLPLPPASVVKAATALYALDRLGPDHRFETRLIASGARAGGTLRGDIYLQGGGDPELDTTGLRELVETGAAAGIREVTGRFYVDDALFPRIERIDDEQPEVASYNPAVSALNLNFNRAWAEWRRTTQGYDMRVEARSEGLSPPTSAVAVRIVSDTPNGQTFAYAAAPDIEVWSVRRQALGRQGARWLPVRRAAEYAARTFRTLAADLGMSIPVAQAAEAPMMAEVIGRRESRPLADILRDMLDYSTNLTAETVGLAATRASGALPESLAASAGAMNAWAAGLIGVAPGDPGLAFRNHSGLSADSRASARRLVQLLAAADGRGFPGLNGGRAATLAALLEEREVDDPRAPPPPHAATVRAKTGTMNFVSGLAGYVTIETGRRLGFAILSADLARRDATLGEERPAGSSRWIARARGLQSALVRSWIARFGAAES